MQRWDIFCAVVDNFGDIGVCWRLARQLSGEFGVAVRLWVDQLEPFAVLCPGIQPELSTQIFAGVEVRRWGTPFPAVEPADVVIEAFACTLPDSYVGAMAVRTPAPVWINLEYLSAESWVEECHGLSSPQRDPRLRKFFFFPGFTPQTGGLLRERALFAERDDFLSQQPSASPIELLPRSGERDELRVSLFCYQNDAIPSLLDALVQNSGPVRLFVCACPALEQINQWWGDNSGAVWRRGALTIQRVPFLTQPDYDRLLWSCQINFVRGEDSFVRAQWAAKPVVWQIYPQTENAHLAKLNAFLERYLTVIPAADSVRRLWLDWNLGANVGKSWPEFVNQLPMMAESSQVWAAVLDRSGNLAENLLRFVRDNLA